MDLVCTVYSLDLISFQPRDNLNQPLPRVLVRKLELSKLDVPVRIVAPDVDALLESLNSHFKLRPV